MSVWKELGVDPLELRLIQEESQHRLDPVAGEALSGRVRVEDLSEHADPTMGIEEQIDLSVQFRDSLGRDIAQYRCSFRAPLARAVSVSPAIP